MDKESELCYFLSEEARKIGVIFKAPRRLDAGFDIQCLYRTCLEPHSSALIGTGLHLSIPEGFVGLIRDRSSVALRGTICAAGVIDASYRGEVKVLMFNLSNNEVIIEPLERICQCLILPHFNCLGTVLVRHLSELGETERGAGGFGSTGR